MDYKKVQNIIPYTDKNQNKHKRYDYEKVTVDCTSGIRGEEENIKGSR